MNFRLLGFRGNEMWKKNLKGRMGGFSGGVSCVGQVCGLLQWRGDSKVSAPRAVGSRAMIDGTRVENMLGKSIHIFAKPYIHTKQLSFSHWLLFWNRISNFVVKLVR